MFYSKDDPGDLKLQFPTCFLLTQVDCLYPTRFILLGPVFTAMIAAVARLRPHYPRLPALERCPFIFHAPSCLPAPVGAQAIHYHHKRPGAPALCTSSLSAMKNVS